MASDWFLGWIDRFSAGNAPIGPFEFWAGKFEFWREIISLSFPVTSLLLTAPSQIRPRWCPYTTSLIPSQSFMSATSISLPLQSFSNHVTTLQYICLIPSQSFMSVTYISLSWQYFSNHVTTLRHICQITSKSFMSVTSLWCLHSVVATYTNFKTLF